MTHKIKPSLPKGMRDFLPAQVAKRRYIISTIQSVFEKYGFQPIETPVMENLDTLTGKYGEEGDKLLFKVLDSGDYLNNVDEFRHNYNDNFNIILRNIILKSVYHNHNSIDVYLDREIVRLNNINNVYLSEDKDVFDLKSAELVKLFFEKNRDLINDYYQSIQTRLHSEEVDLVAEINSEKILFDFYEFINKSHLKNLNSRKLTPQISEKGLRYDLTVPLARYVVQNQNDIVFPFKRYHIAPVWRADRPQKGRYREFYQCDADVIGSNSLVNEVELAKIYAEVFNKLGINVSIKVNSRKILSGLLEHLHLAGKAPAIIAEIDKLDKIGKEKVLDNITALGADDEATDLIEKVLLQQDKASIDAVYNENVHFQQGINEIGYLKSFDIPHLEIDFSLARGLDYYTGCIFEVKSLDYHIGSIGGGGRYDNLTEMFGKQDLTGVGISFGLDRIYDVLEALNKFPETLQTSTKLMFAHFDEVSLNFAFGLLEKVRSAGISAEVYPDVVKLNKQLKYANDKQIAYVCVIGENEVQTGILTLKNMRTGEQEKVKIDTLIEALDDYKPNY